MPNAAPTWLFAPDSLAETLLRPLAHPAGESALPDVEPEPKPAGIAPPDFSAVPGVWPAGPGDPMPIFVTGAIEVGSYEKFADQIIGLQNVLVVLDSEGGNLLEALEMARRIRLSGFSTVIPEGAKCASGCALAWLAGQKRFIASDAKCRLPRSVGAGADLRGGRPHLVFRQALALGEAQRSGDQFAAPLRLPDARRHAGRRDHACATSSPTSSRSGARRTRRRAAC